MTCDEAQVQLPLVPRERVRAEVARHVAQCPACSTWQLQLQRLERHLPRIPVPASAARAELLREIAAGR